MTGGILAFSRAATIRIKVNGEIVAMSNDIRKDYESMNWEKEKRQRSTLLKNL
jgi:hypothetical protein